MARRSLSRSFGVGGMCLRERLETSKFFAGQAQCVGERPRIAAQHLQTQKRIGSETVFLIDRRHALERRNIAQKRGNNAQNAVLFA